MGVQIPSTPLQKTFFPPYYINFVKNIIELINGTYIIINFDFNRKEKKINKCECGKEIYYKSKKCVKCQQKSNRKADRPNHEILLEDIKILGYRGTGKKYGVSDTSIKKWLLNGSMM